MISDNRTNLGFLLFSLLLSGCGGADSDPKLSSPGGKLSNSDLSGVVLDGYLKNAKVCLDKNNNAVCDSGDGDIATTDEKGRYQLELPDDSSQYMILVEVLSGVTIDMDSPSTTVTQDYILEVPASEPNVISPLTSVIASVAKTSGITFAESTEKVAQDLGVDSTLIKSDYAAESSSENQSIHMLARGIALVLQQANEESMNSGVSQKSARKGSITKLAQLDITAIKQRTDNISFGADNADEALKKIGDDFHHELKVTPDDIDGDIILITPKAPQNPVVNDSADTFNWSLVNGFSDIEQYEYSLNSGATWMKVVNKPLSVGNTDIAVGAVQVRVAANIERSFKAGDALLSDKAYTKAVAPPAPKSLTTDDANNQFDWTFSTGFTDIATYEFSLDNGVSWNDVTTKPQPINDINIPAGALKLRVKEDLSLFRLVGLSAKSEQAMTVTPETPLAPIVTIADDNSDLLGWQWVSGFDKASDYEINLSGEWEALTTNPYQVGNKSYPQGQIKIRVKANAVNGMSSGASLVVSQVFTQSLSKPATPTNPKVDDANNKFGWTYVADYSEVTLYEISMDGGITYRDAASNPEFVADSELAIGKVCVRVKESTVSPVHESGESLCSDKPYTVTPNAPAAPTQGVIDDALDTFSWQWTSGFENVTDYQYRIRGAEWQSVINRPIELLNEAYSVNSIEIRVKSDPITGRLAGAILANSEALTVRPDAPNAPTNMVLDDLANTIDWSWVTGFESALDYEYSLNSGTEWQQVMVKPIAVGDIALAIGDALVRVKANSQNGMPVGATLANSEALTQTPKLPAPTGGEILNDLTVYTPVKTNALTWDYLSVDVDGRSVSYSRPEYYEFTRDKGNTWLPVTAKPLHVGRLAYDKASVAIRLKKDAIDGQSNTASEPMWTTSLTGEFYALEYVPMKTSSEVADIQSYNGAWSTYGSKCIAQYNKDGSGEPVYWASRVSLDREDVLSTISAANYCGLSGWFLPSDIEVKTLSSVARDTLPKALSSDLISDDVSQIWANKTGALVLISNGAEVAEQQYSSKYAFPKWQLAPTSDLISNINIDISSLTTVLSNQQPTLVDTEAFLQTWLTDNKQVNADYAALLSQSDKKITDLKALVPSWEASINDTTAKLELVSFQAEMVANRTGSSRESFLLLVKEYKDDTEKQKENLKQLNALIKGTEFASQLVSTQISVKAIETINTALSSATLGSAIHQASLDLYAALSDLESKYAVSDTFTTEFNQVISGLNSQQTSLATLYQELLNIFAQATSSQDVVQLAQNAKDGLERANAAGFVVAQQDALVSSRWAKRDELGRYLPAATTFSQGWRCVEDTQYKGKQRVWTLLKDGLPNGKDDVAYDASSTGKPSLLGSEQYLQAANSANVCGFNNWEVPQQTQLHSLKTASVNNVSEATIDVLAFPNHKAMLPEYDKSTFYDGTEFYYWTATQSSASRQQAMRFPSVSSSQTVSSFDKDGTEDRVILARLVREDSVSYELLNSAGVAVSDRLSAVCAKNPISGEVWQLFANTEEDARFKTSAEIEQEITDKNTNSVCGVSNWQLPSQDELHSILPIDSSVFSFNAATSSSWNSTDKYRTSRIDGSYVYLMDMDTGEVDSSYNSSSNETLYRLIAK